MKGKKGRERERISQAELRAMEYKLLRCITIILSNVETSKVIHPIPKIVNLALSSPSRIILFNTTRRALSSFLSMSSPSTLSAGERG